MTTEVANPPVQSITLLFSALLLVMLLSALDQTIVSTALPTIVGELGGLDKLSVVTAYILSSTIAVPLYGKFGDLFGRKIVRRWRLTARRLRALRSGAEYDPAGIDAWPAGARRRRPDGDQHGGGRRRHPPANRGRYRAVRRCLRPRDGDWPADRRLPRAACLRRWIFYINLPLGLFALLVIGAVFHSSNKRSQHQIDWLGAIYLSMALLCIILFTSEVPFVHGAIRSYGAFWPSA